MQLYNNNKIHHKSNLVTTYRDLYGIIRKIMVQTLIAFQDTRDPIL